MLQSRRYGIKPMSIGQLFAFTPFMNFHVFFHLSPYRIFSERIAVFFVHLVLDFRPSLWIPFVWLSHKDQNHPFGIQCYPPRATLLKITQILTRLHDPKEVFIYVLCVCVCAYLFRISLCNEATLKMVEKNRISLLHL